MTLALWIVGGAFVAVYGGTLLLQGAIILLQIALWTARITLGAACLAIFGGWRLIDRGSAERAWRGEGSGRPAAWWSRSAALPPTSSPEAAQKDLAAAGEARHPSSGALARGSQGPPR